VRFALTDEQIEFRDAVRGLLADTCEPDDVRAAWADPVLAGGGPGGGNGRVPAAWDALGQMGVLGICVPEVHGGLGMSDEDLVPLLVEVGRAGLPDPVSSTAGVAAGLLRDHAPSGVAAEWLPRLAAGEVAVGVGFGPDRDGGGTPTVAAASSVDVFVLFDRGEVHLVPPSAVDLAPLDSVDGARHLARVTWTPSEATRIVGGPGDGADGSGDAGFVATNAAFDRAALGAAAMLVGLSRRMLDLTVLYASERQQFGVPIGSFQAVKHRLTDASLAVEFAEPLVLRAANSLASGDDQAAAHVSMAKAKASEAARGAAAAALQVHGAIGYTVECDLHLYMKRAWALAVRYGDAEFHRRRLRATLIG
jgi:alkylation response protein AidB-like acyl-CoA dehydrogenase